jgi:hypothetical protein
VSSIPEESQATPDPAFWEITHAVPEGIIDLGIHLTEDHARTTLTAQLRTPATAAVLRDSAVAELVDQLLGARTVIREERVAWAGVLCAPLPAPSATAAPPTNQAGSGSPTSLLLAQFTLVVRPMIDPGPFTPDAAYRLAAQRQYGDTAVVETFGTPYTAGVGIRRTALADPARLPFAGSPVAGGPPIEIAIAEAVLPFPDADACVTVTGTCLGLPGWDALTVLVAELARQVVVHRTD